MAPKGYRADAYRLNEDQKQFWHKVAIRDLRRKVKVNRKRAADDPESPVWRYRNFDEAYAWAKHAYIVEAKSLPEICRVTGFKPYEMNKYVYGRCSNDTQPIIGWVHEIQKWKEYVMEKELNRARKSIGEILDKFLCKISEAADAFDIRNASRPDELKQLIASAKDLLEMERIEQDKPTKIFGYEEISRHNIKEKFQKLMALGIPIGSELEALVNNEEMPLIVDPKRIN